MPVDHKIEITFDGTNFNYVDELGHAGVRKRVQTHDTITWNLTGIDGAAGQVDTFYVVFDKNGDPFHRNVFHAPAGQDIRPKARLDYPSQKTYDYTVTAVLKDGTSKSDDPEIIFDDVDLRHDVDLMAASLATLGTVAQSAFRGLLADLKDAAGLKRDPNAEFFPGGINNIQVDVEAPGITVNITVSGPELRS